MSAAAIPGEGLLKPILELSFRVGVAGLGIAVLLVFGVSLLAARGAVVMAFPPPAITTIALCLMVIAIVCGLMALSVLNKSQTADLLR
jgi:putative ABC transport system permease protein